MGLLRLSKRTGLTICLTEMRRISAELKAAKPTEVTCVGKHLLISMLLGYHRGTASALVSACPLASSDRLQVVAVGERLDEKNNARSVKSNDTLLSQTQYCKIKCIPFALQTICTFLSLPVCAGRCTQAPSPAPIEDLSTLRIVLCPAAARCRPAARSRSRCSSDLFTRYSCSPMLSSTISSFTAESSRRCGSCTVNFILVRIASISARL